MKRSGVKISQKLLLFLDIRHHAAVLDQFGNRGFVKLPQLRIVHRVANNHYFIILIQKNPTVNDLSINFTIVYDVVEFLTWHNIEREFVISL